MFASSLWIIVQLCVPSPLHLLCCRQKPLNDHESKYMKWQYMFFFNLLGETATKVAQGAEHLNLLGQLFAFSEYKKNPSEIIITVTWFKAASLQVFGHLGAAEQHYQTFSITTLIWLMVTSGRNRHVCVPLMNVSHPPFSSVLVSSGSFGKKRTWFSSCMAMFISR